MVNTSLGKLPMASCYPYPIFYLAGVSYFVYGEKIKIYSGADPIQKEFMEAGLNFIRSTAAISVALPLYKIYPSKAFRDFRRIVRRMQGAGEFGYTLSKHELLYACTKIIGKILLGRRYEEIKDAISTGTVDETKAVGK